MNASVTADLGKLDETSDALMETMRRYLSDKVSAEACGKVGFLGASTAYAISVKHEILRGGI